MTSLAFRETRASPCAPIPLQKKLLIKGRVVGVESGEWLAMLDEVGNPLESVCFWVQCSVSGPSAQHPHEVMETDPLWCSWVLNTESSATETLSLARFRSVVRERQRIIDSQPPAPLDFPAEVAKSMNL